MSKALTTKKQTGGAGDKPALQSGGLRKYFTDLKYEWQKVTTPGKKEWRQATIVVFTFTVLLALILFGFDQLMTMFFVRVVY